MKRKLLVVVMALATLVATSASAFAHGRHGNPGSQHSHSSCKPNC